MKPTLDTTDKQEKFEMGPLVTFEGSSKRQHRLLGLSKLIPAPVICTCRCTHGDMSHKLMWIFTYKCVGKCVGTCQRVFLYIWNTPVRHCLARRLTLFLWAICVLHCVCIYGMSCRDVRSEIVGAYSHISQSCRHTTVSRGIFDYANCNRILERDICSRIIRSWNCPIPFTRNTPMQPPVMSQTSEAH